MATNIEDFEQGMAKTPDQMQNSYANRQVKLNDTNVTSSQVSS